MFMIYPLCTFLIIFPNHWTTDNGYLLTDPADKNALTHLWHFSEILLPGNTIHKPRLSTLSVFFDAFEPSQLCNLYIQPFHCCLGCGKKPPPGQHIPHKNYILAFQNYNVTIFLYQLTLSKDLQFFTDATLCIGFISTAVCFLLTLIIS